MRMHPRVPGRKGISIWNRRRQKHTANVIWHQNEAFFPHCSAFCIIHIMHFVKDNPVDFIDPWVSDSKHLTEDLSGHYENVRGLVYLDVACDEADARKLLRKIVIFLV
ncbi:hypothetical protein FR483_n230R [Paramecium bursaria Chlorella virus FR483]|uniref:Uncharacterized protein n230R n=1 Tax=Paramecium bursaria Chlorella virus FR483 TaxID=399781 RepID=A7J6T4_PBCVF|nr:hypothetical protein FR483_n230R [Paramecium bursaria Chlorella virus FR483]ABT15515.1 hypothetical protein FR483_n230R [Paramecium bursaria Chlorella virus FR483]